MGLASLQAQISATTPDTASPAARVPDAHMYGTPSSDGRPSSASWFDKSLEKHRVENQIRSLQSTLARQTRDLEKLVQATEASADDSKKLPIGNKASRLLLTAEKRSWEVGHAAVETDDVLGAMLHVPEQEDSTAVQFLKHRGVTKDSVYAEHRYSDNATQILELAAARSSELSKSVVGTEDLLWGLFATEDHAHSRSQAVKRLEARGVNMALVWNQAELSKNAQDALALAVARTKDKNDHSIGSEDLVEALFLVASDRETSSASAMREAMGTPRTNPRFLAALQRKWSKQWTGSSSDDISSSSGDLSLGSGLEGGSREEADHRSGSPVEESLARMFAVGGLAGVIETYALQPLIYWKTMSQVAPEQLSMMASLKPTTVYRGVLVNAASIGPISAFQYATNGALTHLHRNFTSSSSSSSSREGEKQQSRRATTAAESLGIAAATGALSALVVAPAELVMIAQQTTGLGLGATVSSLARHGGVPAFWRGLSATCMREVGWVVGFLGLAPTIKAALREDSKFFHYNPVAASLFASILAGQAAAVFTQPADTVKSLLQADFAGAPSSSPSSSSRPRFHNTWAAATHLYGLERGGGVGAFWRGCVPRSARCIAAVFILGEAQTKLANTFDHFGWLTAQPVGN